MCQAIQSDIHAMPAPHPLWSIEEHDRLLSKLFRVTWLRHCELPQRFPHSSWIMPVSWERCGDHADAKKQHIDNNKALVAGNQAWLASCVADGHFTKRGGASSSC